MYSPDNLYTMSKQLSQEEIDHLFRFTEKKLVRWYDLQIELVDHLASRIEEEMEADASLRFEAALEKVYKSFGIFGFAKVVQEKETQLQRTARKMWWDEFKLFFTWPKIIVLALLVACCYQLAAIADPGVLMKVFAALYTAASFALLYHMFRSVKTSRKLLLLQTGMGHLSFMVWCFDMCVLHSLQDITAFQFCIYAPLGILFQAASFQLYKKVKTKAISLYPLAFNA